MNLDQIEKKCFILALFIRDDGERFLLGSRAYEFKDKQLHFVANTYQNDIVEVQGNDGVMLAGQVRRGNAQPFDGYIGDSTVNRTDIENYRREFLKFFRKNHYYKVVYIFPDGTAIQRRNGFIVEAPEVQELYQLFPEYHIAMNFEDINYYTYEEDSEGQEIYGDSANLSVDIRATGGLIWEDSDQQTVSGVGSNLTLEGVLTEAMTLGKIDGNTSQFTTTGKNKSPDPSVLAWGNNATDGLTQADGKLTFTAPRNGRGVFWENTTSTGSGQPTDGELCPEMFVSGNVVSFYVTASASAQMAIGIEGQDPEIFSLGTTPTRVSFLTGNNVTYIAYQIDTNGSRTYTFSDLQVEVGSAPTEYEIFTGGIASPNPDYPQAVNTVTGRQEIAVTGKNLLVIPDGVYTVTGCVFTRLNNTITCSGTNTTATNWKVMTGSVIDSSGYIYPANPIPSGTYTLSISEPTTRRLQLGMKLSTGTVVVQDIAIGNKSKTFTVDYPIAAWRLICLPIPSENINGIVYKDIQLEVGTSASVFEQPQKYEVNLGKNLFDKNNLSGVGYLSNNGSITADSPWRITDYIPIKPGATYTMSGSSSGFGNLPSRCYYTTNKTFISGVSHSNSNPVTGTAPANAYYMRESFKLDDIDTVQIEAGLATTYAPYFTPIELCKIGDYQDYIYKSGDDWYLHKEIGKSVLGDLTWTYTTTNTTGVYRMASTGLSSLVLRPTSNGNAFVGICTHFEAKPADQQGPYGGVVGISVATNGSVHAYTPDYNTSSSADAFTTWLQNNNATLYYALATPTDTQITNSALIDQLDALAGANSYWNRTIITVSSPDPNLPAILEISATGVHTGGVVWDNIGATWEDGEGGGAKIISVDSIDNVYPVWEVKGPATNPQISVLDTNTTLTYTGTVTASQDLKIDMFNKTATLNGVSVVGNISGEWVHLQPGTNRVIYSTNNADAPDSTLWWQEIVG